MSTQSDEKSLQGVRVLEIGTSVAVPYGCQILGDFGAEIIKVERVGGGDDARGWAPFTEGVSTTFLSLNRNKRSVALDYKTPEGKALLERLITSADVLAQNLRPGAFAAAGFSWERMHELNPRLIYVEMSGYGRTGPRAAQPAYDAMLQAYSGVVAMTGADGGPPARVPLSMMDMGTGMWLALGVFEALRRRSQTGEGSHVQVSLLETALAWVATPLMGVASGGPVPARLGSGFRGNVPNGAYPAKDGYVFLSAGNNDTFHRLLDAIDASELKDDPELVDNAARVHHRHVVNARLDAATSRFTVAELLERLDRAGVPHSAVNTLDQVIEDLQVRSLGLLQPATEPGLPEVTMVNTPISFDGDYLTHESYPPRLGASTTAVFEELGLPPDEIEVLLDAGIIQQSADHLPEGARS